ncbi:MULTISPECIES: hypothetical protein [unclassified Desulfovibrio]|uniref:hypothetical protein n=1 Tax=unclassified Desulfovibrio TaxID=2593640 RepID=UPI000F5F2D40|nr:MULTISPECIES: hypothetical protein [unclassified Desulfovibrio]RRD71913.1 hypothetical protein EII24_01655 [Desulfovibrio sp. OH1209_COT-279]RRD88126.1 hypothetical protein EII23_01655 [Desulfovibrio sp. OH1186_COT-070]
MERHEDALREYEEKARELLDLTMDLCESRVAKAPSRATAPREALTAAAMSVQESVNTFLAVNRLKDKYGTPETE